MKKGRRWAVFLLALVLAGGVSHAGAASENRAAPGKRFAPGGWQLGVAMGAGPGVGAVGSHQPNGVVMGAVSAGWIVTDTLAAGRWYAGNLEIGGELFAGLTFDAPEGRFAGLTPMLRYNLTPIGPWVPFLEAGVGMVATDIDEPDLKGDLQAGLQGGAGVYYFWAPRKAVAFRSRILHFSTVGVNDPDNGLNAFQVLLGLHWFY